jgi:hypothetical protein
VKSRGLFLFAGCFVALLPTLCGAQPAGTRPIGPSTVKAMCKDLDAGIPQTKINRDAALFVLRNGGANTGANPTSIADAFKIYDSSDGVLLKDEEEWQRLGCVHIIYP